MLAALAAARVPIRQIRLNPGRAQPVTPALQALLSKHGELKARPRPARLRRARPAGEPCLRPPAACEAGQGGRAAGRSCIPTRTRRRRGAADARAPPGPGPLTRGPRARQALAQRALAAYLRSVFLQPDRRVFDVAALPAAAFALSLGLPTAPQLRFMDRAARKAARGASAAGAAAGAEAAGAAAGAEAAAADGTGAGARPRGAGAGGATAAPEPAPAPALSGPARGGAPGAAASGPAAAEAAAGEGRAGDPGAGDEDEFLVVKRRDVLGVDEAEPVASAAAPAPAEPAKKKRKRLRIQVGRASAGRQVFDEDGRALPPLAQLAVVRRAPCSPAAPTGSRWPAVNLAVVRREVRQIERLGLGCIRRPACASHLIY